jgi:membrane protease YdiL (CAAX protease family)
MTTSARVDSPPGHSPLARTAQGYWSQSRQPLASLALVAPLLVVYEAGVLLLGPDAIRNGADVWLRQLLELIGFGQYFLLPILTVCILLGWHHTTRQPWRFSGRLFWGMAAECLLLTVSLWQLARLHAVLLETVGRPVVPAAGRIAEDVVSYVGAGIYEELLFRLILLSAVFWTLGRLGSDRRWRLLAAMLLGSLAFSAAHYLGPCGEPLELNSIVFRFSAGMFFCVLFVYRGFGIAAVVHAGYDIMVGLCAAT